MDRYTYNCEYCGKEYIPKRRIIQKYCSNSCRARAYQLRNLKTGLSELKTQTNEPIQTNKINTNGIGNALAGVLIADTIQAGLKAIFIPEEQKPATKGDLKILEEKLNKRYYFVKNMDISLDGKKPYFDIKDECIVYLKFFTSTI